MHSMELFLKYEYEYEYNIKTMKTKDVIEAKMLTDEEMC